ncbi:MAG: hypothetical protein KDJ29_02285, partial [Hyphomicrobiales bacterium]|nr:hypothetical protein [Hyphomicrobiales bacterium]
FNIPDSLKSDAAREKRAAENAANLQKWEITRVEEARDKWKRTALDPNAGQVVCLSWMIDDGTVETAWSENYIDERSILLDAFERMSAAVGETRIDVCGHNVLGFDLPFVQRRAIINRLRLPHWWPVLTKPWHDRVFDTLLMWNAGQRATGGGSMDTICELLGLPQKGSEFDDFEITLADGSTMLAKDVHGGVVWDLVEAGHANIVAAYCEGDVERTRRMYQRIADSLNIGAFNTYGYHAAIDDETPDSRVQTLDDEVPF